MNPVTPSSIALTAATRRTVHGRLPLPVWTAWTALAAAGVLAGAALLPRAAHAQVGANAPARIGVVGPFPGPSADFGVPMLNGIKLAVDEINAVGGYLGRPLVLVIKDDRTDPDQARKVSQELLAGKGGATIGVCNSGVAL